MSKWSLEQAKLGTSHCKDCDGRIPKSEWRFGKRGPKPRWFHLRCAARGAPVMFLPFAKKAAELLTANAPAPHVVTPEDRRVIEASGTGSLEVLSDLLQSKGDPWGELIALRLAGEDDLAGEHFAKHAHSLCGDLNPRFLGWEHGVIISAALRGPAAAVEADLDKLLALRTASRLEWLAIKVTGDLSAAAIDALSARAPTSLRALSLTGNTEALRRLVLPRLQELHLDLRASDQISLFDAQLPALRELRLMSRPALRAAFFERLVESALLRQLRRLDFDDDSAMSRTLDNAGLALLLQARKRLAHVKVMWVELAGRNLNAKDAAQAKVVFGARILRALKEEKKRTEESPDKADFFAREV